MRRLVFILITAIFPVIAHGDQPVVSEPSSLPIENKICGDGTILEMNSCMASEYTNINAEMEKVFLNLVSVLLRPDGIKKSQAAWMEYRDKECANEVLQAGGSLLALSLNSCRIGLTRERLARLRWHLKQDCNGCPVRKIKN